jgi:hypothetical protein
LLRKETAEECESFEYSVTWTDWKGDSPEETTETRQGAGVWTSTDLDEETCLATKKCSANGGLWFNNMNEEECGKCEGEWMSTNTWSGGTWKHGEVKPLYKWIDRSWGSKNAWETEIDRWRLSHTVMDSVVGGMKLEVESDFVQCMYGGMIDSIEKVACVCGKNREACNQDKLFGSQVKLVETTAYEDAAETAGRIQATRCAKIKRASEAAR